MVGMGEPKITAVTCVRDEGPFMLEWIAYNRLIGVSDFLIFSNDCTDGTDLLLDVLQNRGLVAHLPNPAQGRSYQMEALKAARGHPLVQNSDWIWISDVDEFANILVGHHRFADLIDACGAPPAISLSYRFFANDDTVAFVDEPVIKQFCRTHNPDIWGAETAIEVKTLVRRDFPLWYFGAHRPFSKSQIPVQGWTDGSGRTVDPAFVHAAHSRRKHKFPAKGARRFATLNHYALRSLDSFLVKIERGDANRASRQLGLAYWQDRNDPAMEDRTIQRHLPDLTEQIADWLSDPEISAAHRHCVSRHRARISALRQNPETQALSARLIAAPKISQAEAALCRELETVK